MKFVDSKKALRHKEKLLKAFKAYKESKQINKTNISNLLYIFCEEVIASRNYFTIENLNFRRCKAYRNAEAHESLQRYIEDSEDVELKMIDLEFKISKELDNIDDLESHLQSKIPLLQERNPDKELESSLRREFPTISIQCLNNSIVIYDFPQSTPNNLINTFEVEIDKFEKKGYTFRRFSLLKSFWNEINTGRLKYENFVEWRKKYVSDR